MYNNTHHYVSYIKQYLHGKMFVVLINNALFFSMSKYIAFIYALKVASKAKTPRTTGENVTLFGAARRS